MSEATLKVPAEYVEDLRSAAVAEIGMDASWVVSSHEELERHRLKPDHVDKAIDLADVRGASRSVGEVLDIADQLFERATARTLEVRGETSALAHMAETMADKVIAPRIAEETNTSPYNDEAVENIGALTTALGWATGEAARLHAVASAERKAEKAEAT